MTKFFICLISFLSYCTSPMMAQVWPGDINNNGIVNHVDLLYLGAAFETSGPPRLGFEQGIFWEEKLIDELWSQEFTTDLNYAYADCNGDGFIFFDDQNAIFENYGLTHGTVTPEMPVNGTPNTSPSLSLNLTGEEIIEGNFLGLTLDFGTEDLPVNDFYGLAFTIEYDVDLFGMMFPGAVFFWEDTFIGEHGNFLEISQPNFENGTLEVAFTRLNGQVVDEGFGSIGTFFVVVEDNVVGISEETLETTIYIKDVILFDNNQNSQPVYADSITISILNDDIINHTEDFTKNNIQVYPNPVQHTLWIDAEEQAIHTIEIFHHTGQLMFQQSYVSNKTIQKINTSQWASGTYFAKIQTSNSVEIQNIILQ